ncbi:MAG: alpha/beta hydrolase [Propionivibrio sp.]
MNARTETPAKLLWLGGSWTRRLSARVSRRLSLWAYGAVTSALFGAQTSPLVMRARFERIAATSRASLQRRFPQLTFADHPLQGGPHMESLTATDSPPRAMLYLHGGGYFMGSLASYRRRAVRLSYRCRAEVFVPAYRLSPEHTHPAALDDALAAWRYARKATAGRPLLVTGDSAGGGLALALLLRLRDLSEALPHAGVLLSPWTDLTASGDSVETNRERDRWFTKSHLCNWARHVVGEADARLPYLSPVFGDMSGLPPLLLMAGSDELLLDDARRVHCAARRAGVAAELLVGTDMQHDWPLALPWLQESREAWRRLAKFVEQHAGCTSL